MDCSVNIKGLAFPNEEVEQAVLNIIEEQGFKTYTINLSAGSSTGDNYLGLVYRATVTGKKNDNEEETLKLICKLAPTNPARREKFTAKEIFEREVHVYNEIWPLMRNMQEEKGIREGKFDAIPLSYIASDKELNEFIIMGDLREEGYTMFDRYTEIDFDHSKLVMAALGRFHAFSFALRDQQPEILEKYKTMKETIMYSIHMNGFYKASSEMALKALNKNEIDLVRKINLVKENYIKLFRKCIHGPSNEPYSVISHGDAWVNNMMFQYKEGKVTDVKLLDWQLCRYSSPVLDILHFIFVCTQNPFRSENYEELLSIYYKSLSDFLKRLGSDPEKLFPYSAFQDQLKKYGIFGLLMGMFFIRLIVQKSEDIVSMDDLSENMNGEDSDDADLVMDFDKIRDVYTVRMGDVIHDVDRLGYLDILNP